MVLCVFRSISTLYSRIFLFFFGFSRIFKEGIRPVWQSSRKFIALPFVIGITKEIVIAGVMLIIPIVLLLLFLILFPKIETRKGVVSIRTSIVKELFHFMTS